ncbi:MAG: hypothetical protein WEB60_10340 [Terrimicrobiaceae bacterium]
MIKSLGACLLTALFLSSASAQNVVLAEPSVTSMGTITEFSPETIILTSESSKQPVKYVYSKTTTYVDEAGNPVEISTVKSGVPVTVYYTKSGENLMATKVIVRKAVLATDAVMEEKTTTTTTTTTEED